MDLTSLVFLKSQFPTLDAVATWMKENGVPSGPVLETFSKWRVYFDPRLFARGMAIPATEPHPDPGPGYSTMCNDPAITGERAALVNQTTMEIYPTGRPQQDPGLDELDMMVKEVSAGVSATFEKTDDLEKMVEFSKLNDEKQIVYGIVYAPDVVDSQGDWATAADIEKMAHTFLLEQNVYEVDTQHDLVNNGSAVVESFIVRKDDPDFPVGAWVVGVKVSDHLWPMVKSGEIKGFSMYGTGSRHHDQPLGRAA